MRILILGGTAEARELARILVARGCEVTTSLAGATARPLLPAGSVRFGGFGGEAGLVDYLAKGGFDIVADATHPFAVQISRHAAAAARQCAKPYVRLERPAWVAGEGDKWTTVKAVDEAARAVPAGVRLLLTVGRREIAAFLARADLSGIARMIEEPDCLVPPGWRVLRARPPFTLEDEKVLIAAERITHLVTKNAGGEMLRAKIDAARETNIPVIMIARPAKPDAPSAPSAETMAALLMA